MNQKGSAGGCASERRLAHRCRGVNPVRARCALCSVRVAATAAGGCCPCVTQRDQNPPGGVNREMISYYLTTSMTLPEILFVFLTTKQKARTLEPVCCDGEKGGTTEEALFANKPVSCPLSNPSPNHHVKIMPTCLPRRPLQPRTSIHRPLRIAFVISRGCPTD